VECISLRNWLKCIFSSRWSAVVSVVVVCALLLEVGYLPSLQQLSRKLNLSGSAFFTCLEILPICLPSPSPRVAVCVSGQPRTLNLSLISSLSPMRVDEAALSKATHPYGQQVAAKFTTADNIQSMFFSSLPAFDVFMYVSTTEDHPALPRVGDTSICEPLRPRDSSNHLLCEVVRENRLNGTDSPIMNSYVYQADERLRQGLLQQLHGMKQCHRMQKEYTARIGVQYSHMVRLRPDNIFLAPFPPLDHLPFISPEGNRQVLSGSRTHCCCGNEDWFGIGRMQEMEPYMDRVDALPAYHLSGFNVSDWIAEKFLTDYLERRVRGTQLRLDNPQLQVCVHKPKSRTRVGEP